MKKGQIYILTALILIVIIYGMVTVVNKVSQENIESDFEKLSTDYAREGAKLINDVRGQDGQGLIVTTFKDYTRSFTSYSKTQSTEFGLIYAFYYTGTDNTKGRVYIGNYLNMPMLVSIDGGNNYNFLDGCYAEIPAGISFDGIKLNMDLSGNAKLSTCEQAIPAETQQEISISDLHLTIGGYGYKFDIKPGQIQIIIVSREDYPEQRKVFVGGTATNTEEGAKLFSDYCQTGGGAGCSGTNPDCSVDYQTKDDCNRDRSCEWNDKNDICNAKT